MANITSDTYKYSFGTRNSQPVRDQFPQAKTIINPHQVHGDTIVVIDSTNNRTYPTADGLITCEKNIVLTIKTADCVPIIYIDNKIGLVGISHQGYKGTLLKISQKMIKKMKTLGSKGHDINVFIGPAVCKKCYAIDGDRLVQFKQLFNIKHNTIDLKYLNREMLLQEGVLDRNINISSLCTSCNPELFYSYRNGERNTCMVNFIVLV